MQDAATICRLYIKGAKKQGFHLALWLLQRAKHIWIDLFQMNYMDESVSRITKDF